MTASGVAFAENGFRMRRQTARSLREVVKAADQPGLLLGPAIPVSRAAVLAWRHGLLGLAERLERPGPVNPCGVARALVLITDGVGPLYDARSNDLHRQRAVFTRSV